MTEKTELAKRFIGKLSKYLDKADSIVTDKTLMIIQPFIVSECAPPVDFLIIPTPKKIRMLSYQKWKRMPNTDIIIKIVTI